MKVEWGYLDSEEEYNDYKRYRRDARSAYLEGRPVKSDEAAVEAYRKWQKRYRERRKANQDRPTIGGPDLFRLHKVAKKARIQGIHDELTKGYLDEIIQTLEASGAHQLGGSRVRRSRESGDVQGDLGHSVQDQRE